MKKNRISLLVLMPELYHGGAEKQFRKLVDRLDKSKFNISIAIEHSYGDNNHELEKEYFKDRGLIKEFHFKGLNTFSTGLSRFRNIISANIQIASVIRKTNPDIVILYSTLGLIVTKTCKLLGVKTLFSERNAGTDDKKFYKKNKLFLKAIDKLVCNSNPAKVLYSDNGYIAEYVPNGIQHHEPLVEIKDIPFIITEPARIARIKNQELLIKAASLLRDKNILLKFVGKVEEPEYKKYLIELVNTLGMEEKIEFHDFSSDIESIYRDTSIIALPSRSEGFANVILESYMYGRFCIVSDIPMNRAVGSKEQVYFDCNSEKEVAELIINAMSMDKSKKNSIIRDNWHYVNENFSEEKMIERYSNIIIELNSIKNE